MLKLTLLVLCSAVSLMAAPANVDFGLRSTLKSQGTANIVLTFREGTASVLNSIKISTFNNREERLTTLTSSLKANAEASQKQVLAFLGRKGLSFGTLWITNQLYVYGADLALVESLSAFEVVAEISEEEIVELDEPIDFKPVTGISPLAEWGVDKIQAPAAWALAGGNNGQGIRVATIDTGVLITHEALKDNFVGTYGWFDPYQQTPEPNDQNGHGTHTTGTIAGQNGIGVAPGSTWMACKGCATSMCGQVQLLECGQFTLCPTLTDGSAEDCSKAPHLVSNSWGGGRGNTAYHGMIDAWVAAEIVPIFSNGNSGPSCGSANSPADHPDVIGIGSTTAEDAISSFSSLGPSIGGINKPDISAPGSAVISSYNTADDAYVSLSGTSMAAPHVAGVVALLKAHNPNLSIAQVKEHLYGGATTLDLVLPGKNCGDVDESIFPNHAFGHGRVNALDSLKSLIAAGKH